MNGRIHACESYGSASSNSVPCENAFTPMCRNSSTSSSDGNGSVQV